MVVSVHWDDVGDLETNASPEIIKDIKGNTKQMSSSGKCGRAGVLRQEVTRSVSSSSFRGQRSERTVQYLTGKVTIHPPPEPTPYWSRNRQLVGGEMLSLRVCRMKTKDGKQQVLLQLYHTRARARNGIIPTL